MRILLIATAALALACGGDWVAWTVLTARLRNAFAQWTETMHAQGWTVVSHAPVSGGFPFAAILELPDFSLSGGASAVPAGIRWSAEELTLGLTIFHPGRLLIEPLGPEVLRISRSPPLAFSADRIAAWVPLGRKLDAQSTGSVELEADSVSGGIDGSRHPQDVEVGRLRLHLDVARDAAGSTRARLRLDAREVGLPDIGRWPLGDTVSAMSADMSLFSPSLVPADPDDADDVEAAAAAWRDGNGALTIHAFDLKWGPLSLGLQGSIGLDDKLQPAGTGTARTVGYEEALDALARSGRIQPGVAATAKAVLGLMGRAPADHAAGIELPFTLKNSTVSIGKIPLTKVNEVDWGRV
jgi:hypothetical protein